MRKVADILYPNLRRRLLARIDKTVADVLWFDAMAFRVAVTIGEAQTIAKGPKPSIGHAKTLCQGISIAVDLRPFRLTISGYG